MVKRIELINFMSHPHTIIEPAEGLTVLSGDNNTGKSAVIAALQILSRNTAGDFMVRHGERECRIIVETDDGNILEWKRKNNTVSYVINGRDVHRLRGAVPDDLHDLLRMPLVDAEGGAFDIHFGEQKKPIFLLDESPARRATFFASASDTIKLIEMQNRHRQKVRDAKMAEKRLEKDKSRFGKRLEALAPLETLDKQLKVVEAEHATILALGTAIDKLARIRRKMHFARNRVNHWTETAEVIQCLSAPPALAPTDILSRIIRGISNLDTLTQKIGAQMDYLAELPMPPQLSDTRRLSDRIGQINQAEIRKRNCKKRAAVLLRLPQPPKMADTKKLEDVISRIDPLSRTIKNNRQIISQLNRCQPPPEIQSLDALKAIISRLEIAENDIHSKTLKLGVLESLSPPPEAADTGRLGVLIRSMQDYINRRDRLAKEKNQLERKTAQAEAELRQWIDHTGICPTCGQQINPDQFMGHAFNGGQTHE